MRLSGRLVLGAAALALAGSTVACTGRPQAPASPTVSAVSPTASAPTTTPPTATAPTIRSAALPTETMPVRVLAVSGEHVVVQADVTQKTSTYRVSHDGGRTWADAHYPCANPDGCNVVPPGPDRVGRAVGGVAVAYSAQAGRLDAYSLPDDAVVGRGYVVASAESVYDLAGGLALLNNSLTGAFTVHSLLDGTDRIVSAPDGASAYRLLDDGSVLASATGAGTTWLRIAPHGSTAPVFAPTSGTGAVLVNGPTAWFQVDQRHLPPRYCAVDVMAGTSACSTGLTRFDRLYAAGDSGLIVAGYTGKAVQFTWLAYSGGTVARAVRLDVAKAWDPGWMYSAEKAPPVLAVRGAADTHLARPGAGGRLTTRSLDWAVRAVQPNSLGLGTDAVVGSFASHSRSLSWIRSLSGTAIGDQRRLGASGDVAASGSLLAFPRPSGGVQMWNNGRVGRTLNGFVETSGLTFAGSALLGRPLCRQAPLQTDDDCEGPAVLADTRTGNRISVPVGTEDAHDGLLVYRGGDHTVASTVVVVAGVQDTTVAPVTIDLPDPGSGGYYTDVRVRGDWIGATQHRADGTVHPVLANHSTGRTLVGPDDARFLALGDGIAVTSPAHTTALRVWEFTTGATQDLAAASTVVAVDGTRVAYSRGAELVVADFAG